MKGWKGLLLGKGGGLFYGEVVLRLTGRSFVDKIGKQNVLLGCLAWALTLRRIVKMTKKRAGYL